MWSFKTLHTTLLELINILKNVTNCNNFFEGKCNSICFSLPVCLGSLMHISDIFSAGEIKSKSQKESSHSEQDRFLKQWSQLLELNT